MTYLELIGLVGNSNLVSLYLSDKISSIELGREIGSSNLDLVKQYKIEKNQADKKEKSK